MKIVLAHFFAFVTGFVFSAGLASLYAETVNRPLNFAFLLLFALAVTAFIIILRKFNMLRGHAPVLPLGITLLAGIKLVAFLMAPDSMWNWTMDADAARNLQLTAVGMVMFTPFLMGGLHALAYPLNKKV